MVVLVDQNVGGLEITMDDAAHVRMLYRFCQRDQHTHTLFQGPCTPAGSLQQWLPGHVFHGQIGQFAVCSHGAAALVDTGNTRVLQRCQKARFVRETLAQARARELLADGLQGHPALGVWLQSQIDTAHAAAADTFEDAIGPDALQIGRRNCIGSGLRRSGFHGHGSQQGFHLARQLRVATTQLMQLILSAGGIQAGPAGSEFTGCHGCASVPESVSPGAAGRRLSRLDRMPGCLAASSTRRCCLSSVARTTAAALTTSASTSWRSQRRRSDSLPVLRAPSRRW